MNRVHAAAGMWRAGLVILSAVLLPLPLMWASIRLLGGLPVSASREEGRRFVPILAPDEARRLLSFERTCQGDEDCDDPLVCLPAQLMLRRACVASTCTTDADCSEGLSCHSIAAGERVVRLCGAPGEVAEGQLCMELPLLQNLACAPGLACTHKKCRRPCQPQAPRSCPEGFYCHAADSKGSVCLPTCEGRSCPEGQRCVALKHGVSICARVKGTDCQLHPCPVGQVCEIVASESQNRVGMMCLPSCDPQAPSCPEGFSCMGERCIQRCEWDEPGTCGPLEKCAGASERQPGLCLFDVDK